MKLRLLARLFIPLFVIALAAPGGMFAQGAAPAGQAAPAAALAEKLPFDAAVTPRHAAERARLLHPAQHAARRSGSPCGSRSRPARSTRRTISRGWRTSSSTWPSTAPAHFKPGELIAALESTGARLGPHVNAYTSFDETVYMFELPTDKTGLVEKGMQALADFAGGMTLDPDRDRQGARRRHRGVARRPRRRLADPRPADSGALLRVEVRRAAADRQARDPASVQAGAPARVLHQVVSPGSHGGGRGRRRRGRQRSRR